jgi:high-affinity iron transporter
MLRRSLWLLCAACALASHALAQARPADATQALRQVAGVLEYIGGDYRGAVGDDGNVLQASEYAEQQSLAKDADALAAHAGLAADDALRVQLADLQRALAQRSKLAQVSELCRKARETIVLQHGVTLTPEATPSRERGAQLYASQGCPTCHGADGAAQTEAAQKLEPHPANFLDPERTAAVSPHRAFHAISFGVPGTAMQAYPQLSEAQRWDLAFYVLSLRHAHADYVAGKRAFDRARPALPRSAAGLAGLTEDDILAGLDAIPAAERPQVLGYLRAAAPFDASAAAEAGSSLQPARLALQRGLAAYRKGDVDTARREFVSAYLDGFEPHEAAIGARDHALVQRVERNMLAVRQAAANSAAPEQVAQRVRDAEAVLAIAEHAGSDGNTALVGALTIALREGLEIALLIGALLGLVRKRGQPQLARFVHAGWGLAAGCGLLTWMLASQLLSGLHRELAEGIAALLAAVVLLGVTHWLLGQVTAKRFMGFLAVRMGDAAGRRAGLGILGLSFVAAYREAFEIVLFFQALLLDAGEHRSRVWLGAALGLLALGVVAFALKRIGQRLQPRPFMLLSSGLLALLSFALAGKGIRAFQEAAVLGMTEVRGPELSWLGIYPTLQGLCVQGVVLVMLVASALWPVWSQRQAARASTPKDRVPAP